MRPVDANGIIVSYASPPFVEYRQFASVSVVKLIVVLEIPGASAPVGDAFSHTGGWHVPAMHINPLGHIALEVHVVPTLNDIAHALVIVPDDAS